jgi:hypothetical protein
VLKGGRRHSEMANGGDDNFGCELHTNFLQLQQSQLFQHLSRWTFRAMKQPGLPLTDDSS